MVVGVYARAAVVDSASVLSPELELGLPIGTVPQADLVGTVSMRSDRANIMLRESER